MIHLIAPRIKLAEWAAHFLFIPKGEWRFIVEERDMRGKRAEQGQYFVWVKAPRYQLTPQDQERQDWFRAYLKEHQIQTMEYTLP